jgi:predicted ribosome quality control (RQC) complex YloA/Tae2 family protein
MAAQNDMWFHAHGYPGSHVILKREGRKDEPSKQTLEEAAAIAAFWSKGKSAKKVPVVYTLAKYVSKPRGGAPGQAVLKREKTLIVEPQIPKTKDDA